MDYHSCGQSNFASIDQFFIIPVCQIVQIVNSQPIVLEACQHSNYAGKIFQFQYGTHESPKFVKPQKKHLESMFCGTSTKSKVVQIFWLHMQMAKQAQFILQQHVYNGCI